MHVITREHGNFRYTVHNEYTGEDTEVVVDPDKIALFEDTKIFEKLPFTCPFFRHQPGSEMAYCTVHATRPEICRDYGCWRLLILGVKFISLEVTFDEDTSDTGIINATLEGLIEDVHRNLCDERLRCRTVTIKIRYQGFVTRIKARALAHYTNDWVAIRSTMKVLAREIVDGRKVRLIGVRLSSLEERDPGQMTLGY